MYWKKFSARILKIGPECYSYKKFIRCVHNEYETKENVYPCVFPPQDTTPRRGKEAVVFTGGSPELFAEYLRDTIEIAKKKQSPNRVVFINAWNEWGEGNYLEPDMKFGRSFLDACKKVLK